MNARHISRLGCLLAILIAVGVAVTFAVESDSGDEGASDRAVSSWPRRFDLDDGTRLTLYQPQFERWVDFQALRGTAAVSYERSPGESEPLLGTVIFDAASELDAPNGQVRVHGITLLEGAYTGLTVRESKILTSRLVGLFPRQLVMCLGQVLAGIRRGIDVEEGVAPAGDPPLVLVRQAPVIEVRFDGEPRFEPAETKSVERAANTDRVLYHLPKKGTYYLLADGVWLRSSSLAGAWTLDSELPKALRKVGAADRLPSPPASTEPAEATAAPEVVVATEPTELVVTEEEPELESIGATDLQWVTNADGALFFDAGQQEYFLLASSGHWLRADSLAGPWLPAADRLPAGLIEIPPEHPRASVLAWVPGTPAAREAAMRALIPPAGGGQSSTGGPFELGEFDVVGENTFYAGQDGQVYHRDGSDWLELVDGEWRLFAPPEPPANQGSGRQETWGPDSLQRAARRRVYNLLEWDYGSRLRGQARCLRTVGSPDEVE